MISSNSSIEPERLGFGETVRSETPLQNRCNAIHIIAIVILVGLTLSAIGAVLGTLTGLVLIAASVSSAKIIGIGALCGVGGGFIVTPIVCLLAARRFYRPVPADILLKPSDRTRPGELIQNSEAAVTKHAAETTQIKCDLIRQAKQSVMLSGNFCGGKPFQDALKAMREALRASPKLQIHLLASEELLEGADVKALEQLQKDYPSNCHFLITHAKLHAYPRKDKWLPGIHSIENHVKILIVDGIFSITGGTNLQTNLCREGDKHFVSEPNTPFSARLREKFWTGATRDMDVVVKSAGVAQVIGWQFIQLGRIWAYQMQSGTALATTLKRWQPSDIKSQTAACPLWEQLKQQNRVESHVIVQPLISEPSNTGNETLKKENAIVEAMKTGIKNARQTIYVANMSFCSQSITEALSSKISDKQVTVITNGSHPHSPASTKLFVAANNPHYLQVMTGISDTNQLNASSFNALQKNAKKWAHNVKILHFQLNNTMYHKKVIVIDGIDQIIGSTNINDGKSDYDFEMAFRLISRPLAQKTLELLQEDETLSVPVTLESAFEKRTTLATRLQAGPLGNFL